MLEKLPAAVGKMLHQQRAGLDEIAFELLHARPAIGSIDVSSPAFDDREPLPARYTADGAGLSPPLAWNGIPLNADSLLLIVEDADAPSSHPLVHAIAVDLPPRDDALAEGALNDADFAGAAFRMGRNSSLQMDWLAPDPPPGHGVHQYAFQIFALAAGPDLPDQPGREAVLDAIRERAVAGGCLIGTYERAE